MKYVSGPVHLHGPRATPCAVCSVLFYALRPYCIYGISRSRAPARACRLGLARVSAAVSGPRPASLCLQVKKKREALLLGVDPKYARHERDEYRASIDHSEPGTRDLRSSSSSAERHISLHPVPVHHEHGLRSPLTAAPRAPPHAARLHRPSLRACLSRARSLMSTPSAAASSSANSALASPRLAGGITR